MAVATSYPSNNCAAMANSYSGNHRAVMTSYPSNNCHAPMTNSSYTNDHMAVATSYPSNNCATMANSYSGNRTAVMTSYPSNNCHAAMAESSYFGNHMVVATSSPSNDTAVSTSCNSLPPLPPPQFFQKEQQLISTAHDSQMIGCNGDTDLILHENLNDHASCNSLQEFTVASSTLDHANTVPVCQSENDPRWMIHHNNHLDHAVQDVVSDCGVIVGTGMELGDAILTSGKDTKNALNERRQRENGDRLPTTSKAALAAEVSTPVSCVAVQATCFPGSSSLAFIQQVWFGEDSGIIACLGSYPNQFAKELLLHFLESRGSSVREELLLGVC
ncbi:hypothetical protein Ancab_000607 [Ancistrocladus abbreviatus]